MATITINRAPVLTLWATVVAERLGYDPDAALTLGKAVAGLNAQAKGRTIGIFSRSEPSERGGEPKKRVLGEEFWIELLGRPVPAKNTDAGVRAVIKDKPINPDAVRKYLSTKFGEDLDAARDAMQHLAASLSPDDLAERAYGLYERFRPQIPAGKKGWGAAGEVDLDALRSLNG